MKIRMALCSLLVVICLAPMFMMDVAAYDPVPVLDPGPIGIPSGDFEAVAHYTYPLGKTGYRSCPDAPSEVAFSEKRVGDYCLATSIALGGVGDLYSGKRILTLMVSVCYTYAGTRLYLKGAINNFRLIGIKLTDTYSNDYAIENMTYTME